MAKPIHLFLSLFSFFTAVATVLSAPGVPFSQQRPSYLGFTYDAREMPPEEYYDYIIVGGGTSGCPLAATLSENHNVLLLERGGIPYGKTNLMTQDGFLATLLEFDNFDSPAERFVSEDGVPNARGRVLGGSSAINAGFYSRADEEFYEKSGIQWDMKLVNESYEWVESKIVFKPELKNWQTAVRDGFLEANMGPYHGFSLDHHLGIKIGGSTFDNAGGRHSAADLLNYANSSNIKVAIHAMVERVIVGNSSSHPERASAVGVSYRDRTGRFHRGMLKDRGEVLLCAGALGSPQLLMLSGIGPRAYLSSWGIPVVREHPDVGQFLYDNPRNGISIVPSTPLEHSLIQVVGITSSGAYLEAASTMIPFYPGASSAVGGGGLFRRRFPIPNPPTHFTVATLMEKIVGPLSTGSLRLASTDIKVNPIVKFNYFHDREDVERCINGSRKIHQVLQSRSMEGFKHQHWSGYKEFRYFGAALPGDVSNDLLMEAFCRLTVTTIWHYHGGCVVGKVVDRNLGVYGIDAMRVVDGSTFTVSPGTNPQATVLMIGRYVGQQILRNRRGTPVG